MGTGDGVLPQASGVSRKFIAVEVVVAVASGSANDAASKISATKGAAAAAALRE